MKKINKIYAIGLAALLAAALAIPAAFAQSAGTQNGQDGQAKQHHGRRGFGRGERFGGHGRGGGFGAFRGLNLTDAQKAQMKQIRQNHSESTKALRQELRTQMESLRQANQGGTFNEAQVAQKLAETSGLRAKLMGEQFKMRQEMLAVLTPEQKAQLEQRREQFKAKRGEWRAKRAEQKQSQNQ